MGDVAPPPYQTPLQQYSPRNPRHPQSQGSPYGGQGAFPGPSAAAGFFDAEHNDTVESLGTTRFAEQLRVIDDLNDLGIDADGIDLPALAVVGDQSAGKSSVLAGITKIPFPRNGGTCTRFVTKVFKRHQADTIFRGKVTIEPAPDRSGPGQDRLKNFQEQVLPDFSNLPVIIHNATAAIFSGSKKQHKFSADVLKVEIWGKDQQPLEITDIPGLVCNGGDDIQAVANIARSHIQKKRSIVLVVIGATKDFPEQAVFELIKNVPDCRERAFGIITKPDVQPDRAESYIELAQNKSKGYELQLGWHVLRNSSPQELGQDITWIRRDEIEKKFFHESPEWQRLLRSGDFESDQQMVGISSLRTRVVQLLSELNEREIPNVRREIKQKLEAHEERLRELGGSREPAELREKLLTSFKDLSRRATDYSRGIYDPRIAKRDMKDEHLQLRSRIEELYDEFAWAVHNLGHTDAPDHFQLVAEFNFGQAGENEPNLRNRLHQFQTPQPISQQDFYRKGLQFLRKNRGEEINTYFDPSRLSLLFQPQSENWSHIAKHFLAESSDKVDVFLEHALRQEFKTEVDVPGRIWEKFLTDRVAARKNAAQEELKRLLGDLERPIKTRSLEFQMRTINLRSDRVFSDTNAVIQGEKNRKNQSIMNGGAMPIMNPESVSIDAGKRTPGQHESKEAARFMDDMLSYYMVARTSFIDNFQMQVVERHLLDNMSAVFDVHNITTEDVEEIQREREDVRQERMALVEKIKRLTVAARVLI